MKKLLLLFFSFEMLMGQDSNNSPVYISFTQNNTSGQISSIFQFPANNPSNNYLDMDLIIRLLPFNTYGISHNIKFNPINSNELYITSYLPGNSGFSRIFVYNLEEASFTGSFEFDEIISWGSLSFDPTSGKLYGTKSDGLFEIILGENPHYNLIRSFEEVIDSITVDGSGNAYALIGGNLYSLDLITGSTVFIGSLNIPEDIEENRNDIAWDPNTGKIFMVCNFKDYLREFRVVDSQTGNSTFLGNLFGGGDIHIAYFTSLTFNGDALNIKELIDRNLDIYPNPTKDKIYLSYAQEIQSLCLYNISGKKVLEEIAFNQKELNISHLPKGLYLLKVQFEDKTESYRILKE